MVNNMEHTYNVEQLAGNRTLYTYDRPNAAGEKLQIEMSLCTGYESTNSLPYLWFKNGYTGHILKTYWNVETYVTKPDGSCWGLYNPIIINGTSQLDFKWMLDGTEENKKKLLHEFECRSYGDGE